MDAREKNFDERPKVKALQKQLKDSLEINAMLYQHFIDRLVWYLDNGETIDENFLRNRFKL